MTELCVSPRELFTFRDLAWYPNVSALDLLGILNILDIPGLGRFKPFFGDVYGHCVRKSKSAMLGSSRFSSRPNPYVPTMP